MDAGNSIQLALTIVLVGITAWYANETRRIVNRMDREREEMRRPELALQLVPWQATLLKLRIQNVGAGPAFDVKGEIVAETKLGIATIPWSYNLLNVGKYEEFGIPVSDKKCEHDYNIIKAAVKKVRATFTYNSSSGIEYTLDDLINIQELTDDWIESQMLATQDHPDRIMPRIAKTLEEIKNKIK
jgi:copper chaperone CopZ